MARGSFAAAAGAGELLERTDSMSSLGELLAGVRSGAEGRLVLVAGEAGVGKTAVLRRFCGANAAAARILWGACEPFAHHVRSDRSWTSPRRHVARSSSS